MSNVQSKAIERIENILFVCFCLRLVGGFIWFAPVQCRSCTGTARTSSFLIRPARANSANSQAYRNPLGVSYWAANTRGATPLFFVVRPRSGFRRIRHARTVVRFHVRGRRMPTRDIKTFTTRVFVFSRKTRPDVTRHARQCRNRRGRSTQCARTLLHDVVW